MKSIIDIIILVLFILFIIFLVRGFVTQIQERQKKREDENKK